MPHFKNRIRRLVFVLAFALVFLPVLSWANSWLPHDGVPELSFASPFWSNGKRYTVFVVKTSQAPSFQVEHLMNDGNRKFANALLETAEEWAISNYVERYPHVPKSFFQKMLAATPMNDGRSSNVIIVEGEDASRVVGTLRFSWITQEHPKYPSEELIPELNVRPLMKYQKGDFQSGDQLWRKDIDAVLASSPEPKGGHSSLLSSEFLIDSPKMDLHDAFLGHWIEIKNFAVKEGSEMDFVPMLFYIAEKSGASLHQIPIKIEGAHTSIVGTEYFLSCNRVMRPYYARLGFTELPDLALSGENVAMTISRENYLKFTANRFANRPGLPGLAATEWDPSETIGFWLDLHSTESSELIRRFGLCPRLLKSAI